MIRIAITQAAFGAICSTLPEDVSAPTLVKAQRAFRGTRLASKSGFLAAYDKTPSRLSATGLPASAHDFLGDLSDATRWRRGRRVSATPNGQREQASGGAFRLGARRLKRGFSEMQVIDPATLVETRVHARHSEGDHCCDPQDEVRVYPILSVSRTARVILCCPCWEHENRYRHERGEELGCPKHWPRGIGTLRNATNPCARPPKLRQLWSHDPAPPQREAAQTKRRRKRPSRLKRQDKSPLALQAVRGRRPSSRTRRSRPLPERDPANM